MESKAGGLRDRGWRVRGVLAINGLLALRTPSWHIQRLRLVRDVEGDEGLSELFALSAATLPWQTVVLVFATVLGVVFGLVQAGHWELFLKWLYAVPFARVAPVLGHDLGFDIFTLPVYGVVRDWAFLLLLLATLGAVSVYWGRDAIDLVRRVPQYQAPARFSASRMRRSSAYNPGLAVLGMDSEIPHPKPRSP